MPKDLEVPLSTPNTAIQYEFGINDLSIDVLSEKVILAVETYKREDNRISKQLFKRMFEKDVPGFCTEVKEACSIFNILFQEIVNNDDVRESMKKKVIEVQGRELLQMMMVSSKTDEFY